MGRVGSDLRSIRPLVRSDSKRRSGLPVGGAVRLVRGSRLARISGGGVATGRRIGKLTSHVSLFI
jgi:hypothetical protein